MFFLRNYMISLKIIVLEVYCLIKQNFCFEIRNTTIAKHYYYYYLSLGHIKYILIGRVNF